MVRGNGKLDSGFQHPQGNSLEVCLPAGFDDAGNHAAGGKLAEAETGEFKFAEESAGATCEAAAVVEAGGRGIAAHFIESNACLGAVLFVQGHIFALTSKLGSFFPVDLYQFFAPFLLFY